MPDDLCEPVSTLTFGDRRIENVLWHPLASDVLAVTSANSLSIMDVSKEAEIYGACPLIISNFLLSG